MNRIGRRLPAEWEKHQATLLCFPHEGRDWPGKFCAVKWAFIEIIRRVALHEPVMLVVRSDEHRKSVAAMLKQAHIDAAFLHHRASDASLQLVEHRPKFAHHCVPT